jgi:uncharacterized protein (DUF1800 family)
MAQNRGHVLIGSYERDAIRPHVLGHFKDLLLATARHPAMLYYLDNWESMAPDSFNVGPFAPRRGIVNGVPNSIIPNGLQRLAHGLNENYGREIMELHTLGVNGGYTQADVIAVARCLPGGPCAIRRIRNSSLRPSCMTVARRRFWGTGLCLVAAKKTA